MSMFDEPLEGHAGPGLEAWDSPENMGLERDLTQREHDEAVLGREVPDWMEVTGRDAVRFIHDLMMDPPHVVPTGIPTVDRSMYGFGQQKGIPRGTYMIVGGASNVGKTQMGLHLARNAAEHGEKAGFISLDMKERDAVLRIHQAIAGNAVPAGHWRPDRWKEEYAVSLQDALVQWRLSLGGETPETWGSLAVFATPYCGLASVNDAILRGIDAGGTFFVVDHLQKIDVEGFGSSQIAGRAEAISERLDNLADEYGVTIVGLSQLHRRASEDRSRKPQMQDLWGGTAMESNASVVLMLDHSRYRHDREKTYISRTWVILDKNQLGPKGIEIPVEWNHRGLKIREALDDEVSLWPDSKK